MQVIQLLTEANKTHMSADTTFTYADLNLQMQLKYLHLNKYLNKFLDMLHRLKGKFYSSSGCKLF